ncbi:uncharacterized protein LOC118433383 [Folsomia candida]|uniref:uncharacterized protein LOC118433383 n=1 Tax=Folsomia candida TaxID=158441 RepID=UPI0016050E04|nr:uncharacterized protein LOC118433383 [Folsomia candida]
MPSYHTLSSSDGSENSDYDQADNSTEDNGPRNFTEASNRTLGQDRTFTKGELYDLYCRLRDELDQVNKNFHIVHEKLGELNKSLSNLRKEHDALENKVNRSSGFFSRILNAIPFGGMCQSAIQTVQDAYNTVAAIF